MIAELLGHYRKNSEIRLVETPYSGKISKVARTSPFFQVSKIQSTVITWAQGHLVTLAEPGDYDKRFRLVRVVIR